MSVVRRRKWWWKKEKGLGVADEQGFGDDSITEVKNGEVSEESGIPVFLIGLLWAYSNNHI